MLSMKEFAAMHGISYVRARQLLKMGRIVGAIQEPNGRYRIPPDAKIAKTQRPFKSASLNAQAEADLVVVGVMDGRRPIYADRERTPLREELRPDPRLEPALGRPEHREPLRQLLGSTREL